MATEYRVAAVGLSWMSPFSADIDSTRERLELARNMRPDIDYKVVKREVGDWQDA